MKIVIQNVGDLADLQMKKGGFVCEDHIKA